MYLYIFLTCLRDRFCVMIDVAPLRKLSHRKAHYVGVPLNRLVCNKEICAAISVDCMWCTLHHTGIAHKSYALVKNASTCQSSVCQASIYVSRLWLYIRLFQACAYIASYIVCICSAFAFVLNGYLWRISFYKYVAGFLYVFVGVDCG